jgi:NAD+ synthase
MHIRPSDIATWLRNSVSAAGADGLLVTLNGTVGSAVTARLCQLALEEKVVAVLAAEAPLSDAAHEAQRLAESLQLRVVRLPLDLAATRLSASLAAALASASPSPTADREWVRLSGLRSRMQMTAAYYVADSLNYLVSGSLDRTDLTLGTFTRHGDTAVDLLPLGTFVRSEVLALAGDLEIPQAVVDRARAGPMQAADPYSTDPGLAHRDLERYLADGPDGVAPAAALKIERLMRAAERRGGPPLMMERD